VRKAVVLAAVLAVLASVPACPVAGQSSAGSGIGLAFPVDWEASTVQVRRTHSEEWKRYVGVLQALQFFTPIPIPLFLFTGFIGPQTDVYEHTKELSGTFLGEPVSGKFSVAEIRRGGERNFVPGILSLTVRGSRFEAVFGPPTAQGYHLVPVPDRMSGVFARAESGGFIRVVGLADRYSVLRGSIVVGWADRQAATGALEEAGWSPDAAGRAVASATRGIVPFPPHDRDNPPDRTLIRWVAEKDQTGQIRVRVLVLVGKDAMPVLEGGRPAQSVKIRVVAAVPGANTTLYEGDAAPGEQVAASGQVSPPAIVMVMAGPKVLFSQTLAAEDSQ
jgi:hypothetical protein